jgi:hypothetical protein
MTEQQKIDQAMKKILSVSRQELQRRLEAAKKTKSNARKISPQPTKRFNRGNLW